MILIGSGGGVEVLPLEVDGGGAMGEARQGPPAGALDRRLVGRDALHRSDGARLRLEAIGDQLGRKPEGERPPANLGELHEAAGPLETLGEGDVVVVHDDDGLPFARNLSQTSLKS